MPILGIIASSISGNLDAGDFESIATVSVGSGGAANVEFTSIPATFTHLQIRGMAKDSNSTTQQLRFQINTDTGNNYAYHQLFGNGSSVSAGAAASQALISNAYAVALNNVTSVFGVSIVDILDYANTNKYKTVRSLHGTDVNGNDGYVGITSGLWQSTSAITSIKFYLTGGANFAQYTQFALYGIRSA